MSFLLVMLRLGASHSFSVLSSLKKPTLVSPQIVPAFLKEQSNKVHGHRCRSWDLKSIWNSTCRMGVSQESLGKTSRISDDYGLSSSLSRLTSLPLLGASKT
ncbi:hypothetical protein Tco_1475176 [Tanacetum coccineum]